MAIRAFVALELPPPVRQRLGALVQRLAGDHPHGVKWAAAETMHLTLKFFGSLPEEKTPAVAVAIDDVAREFGPIDLGLAPLGAFPSSSRPRVLWIGLEGDVVRLRRLQTDVDRRAADLGFAPEDRPFAAHITIGRVREGAGPEVAGALETLLRAGPRPEAARFQAEDLTLFQSTLRPGGPVYTRLHTAYLIGT